MKRKVLFLITIIVGLLLIVGGIYLISTNLIESSQTDKSSDSLDEAEYSCLELDGDETSDDFKISNVKICNKDNLEISFDLTNNTDIDYTDIQVQFYLNVSGNSYEYSIAIDSINSNETNSVVYTNVLDFNLENIESYDFEMLFSQFIGG